MIRTRTKIEVVLAVAFLLAISISSVFAVTRTISDTSDTVDTYIRNSNGKYWEATGANLQAAIYDIGNNPGYVEVKGQSILISSPILCTEKISIDFHNTVLYATTDINIIQPREQNKIRNLIIDVSKVGSYTHSCIYLNGTLDYFNTYINQTVLENININGGTTQDGTGIELGITTGGGSVGIGFCVFSNIHITGFYRGIYLHNNATTANGGGWINGNIFNDITGGRCNYFIFLDNKEGEGATNAYSATSGNVFTNIQYQPGTGTDTYFASIEGNKNIFSNIVIWDWSGLGDSTAIFRLNYTANSTVIDYPFGSSSTNRDFIIDDSALGSSGYLTFSSGNYLKMRGSNAPGLNISHINRYEYSSTGLKLFASTKGNPYTYFYGYADGAAKYGTLRVDSTGSFELTSQQSSIDLEPANHIVNLSSVLKLTGLTAHPTPAYEGMIYYNTTTNVLMLYTTAWHSIDMT